MNGYYSGWPGKQPFSEGSPKKGCSNGGVAMIPVDDYVIEVLLRDLVGHDRRPVCFLVYLWLTAEEQKRKGAVEISYRELAENLGVSKSSAQGAVGWLVRRKLLEVKKASVTATPRYEVLMPWRKTGKKPGSDEARKQKT